MDYRTLGRSGLQVSRLCLGAMMFGGPADAATSRRLIARAFEAGDARSPRQSQAQETGRTTAAATRVVISEPRVMVRSIGGSVGQRSERVVLARRRPGDRHSVVEKPLHHDRVYRG